MAESEDIEDAVIHHIVDKLTQNGYGYMDVMTVFGGGTGPAILFKRNSKNVGCISIHKSILVLEPAPELRYRWSIHFSKKPVSYVIKPHYCFELAHPDVFNRFFNHWEHLHKCAVECGHIKNNG